MSEYKRIPICLYCGGETFTELLYRNNCMQCNNCKRIYSKDVFVEMFPKKSAFQIGVEAFANSLHEHKKRIKND